MNGDVDTWPSYIRQHGHLKDMCGSRGGGTGGPDPPWKITKI